MHLSEVLLKIQALHTLTAKWQTSNEKWCYKCYSFSNLSVISYWRMKIYTWSHFLLLKLFPVRAFTLVQSLICYLCRCREWSPQCCGILGVQRVKQLQSLRWTLSLCNYWILVEKRLQIKKRLTQNLRSSEVVFGVQPHFSCKTKVICKAGHHYLFPVSA